MGALARLATGRHRGLDQAHVWQHRCSQRSGARLTVMNPLLKDLPPVHPGTMLAKEILPYVDLPRAEVARRLGISRTLFYRILARKTAVTPAVALRLGRLFGTSAEMWLGLQRDYDLVVEAERLSSELQAITPLKAA